MQYASLTYEGWTPLTVEEVEIMEKQFVTDASDVRCVDVDLESLHREGGDLAIEHD